MVILCSECSGLDALRTSVNLVGQSARWVFGYLWGQAAGQRTFRYMRRRRGMGAEASASKLKGAVMASLPCSLDNAVFKLCGGRSAGIPASFIQPCCQFHMPALSTSQSSQRCLGHQRNLIIINAASPGNPMHQQRLFRLQICTFAGQNIILRLWEGSKLGGDHSGPTWGRGQVRGGQAEVSTWKGDRRQKTRLSGSIWTFLSEGSPVEGGGEFVHWQTGGRAADIHTIYVYESGDAAGWKGRESLP